MQGAGICWARQRGMPRARHQGHVAQSSISGKGEDARQQAAACCSAEYTRDHRLQDSAVAAICLGRMLTDAGDRFRWCTCGPIGVLLDHPGLVKHSCMRCRRSSLIQSPGSSASQTNTTNPTLHALAPRKLLLPPRACLCWVDPHHACSRPKLPYEKESHVAPRFQTADSKVHLWHMYPSYVCVHVQ